MTVQQAEWIQVHDLSSPCLRFLVDQGLMLIGQQLHERLGPTLVAEADHDWPSNIVDELKTTMPDLRLARFDVLGYRRLLNERWYGRDRLRDAFGRAQFSRASKALEQLRHVRHAHAHPDVLMDVATAERAITTMIQFATGADLPARTTLSEMATSIQELKTGARVAPPTADQISELLGRLGAANSKAAAADAARAAAEAREQAAVDRATNADATLQAAEREREQLRRDIDEAREQRRDADVAAAAQAERREAELIARRAAVDERVRQAEAAREMQVNEADRLRRELEHAHERAAEMEALANEREHQLTQAQAAAETQARQASTVDVNALLLDVIERVRAMQAEQTPARRHDNAENMPEPGEPWPYRSGGEEVWTLSIAGQMYRRDDGMPLAGLVGDDRATTLIANFMKIRPSGGRVWVDQDSDASTYVDGQLVYLGRIYDEPEADTAMPLGSPLPGFKGEKYDLSRGRVTHVATGTTLASVLGRDAAKAVRERLTQLRPKGGVYRVNREGVAATWIDDAWVYAGTIKPGEWFPGHVR